jgi:hypothetical protein
MHHVFADRVSPSRFSANEVLIKHVQLSLPENRPVGITYWARRRQEMVLRTVWIRGQLPLEVGLLISVCPKQTTAPSSGGGEQEFSAAQQFDLPVPAKESSMWLWQRLLQFRFLFALSPIHLLKLLTQ